MSDDLILKDNFVISKGSYVVNINSYMKLLIRDMKSYKEKKLFNKAEALKIIQNEILRFIIDQLEFDEKDLWTIAEHDYFEIWEDADENNRKELYKIRDEWMRSLKRCELSEDEVKRIKRYIREYK